MIQRRLSSDIVPAGNRAVCPERALLRGQSVQLEPIDAARHGIELYAASHHKTDPADLWRYMPYQPFPDLDKFTAWLDEAASSADPLYFAVRDMQRDHVGGMTSYLRITPAHRVIEIGAIWFGPELQKTKQSTEALFLMMRHVLDDLGYRRLEWKCDAANEASRRAAQRLGFTFEGVFNQHMIVKGRNRDTAWYSLLDEEWPVVRSRIEKWLLPENFDESGCQRRSLSQLAC